jgi:hypothetical protein
MATISVNGNVFTVPDGASVTINNGSITVGGRTVGSNLTGIVEVRWEGPAADIKSDANLTVKGHVGGKVDVDGNVSVSGDVLGDVEAGGNVSCGSVSKNIRAGGNIACGSVGGDAKAGGNLVCRK